MSDARGDEGVDARAARRAADVVDPPLGDDEIAALMPPGTRVQSVQLRDGEVEVFRMSFLDIHRLIGARPSIGDTVLRAFIARREQQLASGVGGIRGVFSSDTSTTGHLGGHVAGASGPTLPGIHQISTVCGEPHCDIDSCVGVLGLRRVGKTVSFDDAGTYHANGRQGTGQLTATPFLSPGTSFGYWADRLEAAGVSLDGPLPRFDEQVVSFVDPDGLPLELVARRAGALGAAWVSPAPAEHVPVPAA